METKNDMLAVVTDGCDLPPTGMLFQGESLTILSFYKRKACSSVSPELQTQLKLTSDFLNPQRGLLLQLPMQVGGRVLDNSLKCGGCRGIHLHLLWWQVLRRSRRPCGEEDWKNILPPHTPPTLPATSWVHLSHVPAFSQSETSLEKNWYRHEDLRLRNSWL